MHPRLLCARCRALAQLQATALHCAKTLILASGRGNGVLQYCVGQLLPGLANVLAKSAGTKREPSEPQYAATTEILKTFVGLYSMIAAEHRASRRWLTSVVQRSHRPLSARLLPAYLPSPHLPFYLSLCSRKRRSNVAPPTARRPRLDGVQRSDGSA